MPSRIKVNPRIDPREKWESVLCCLELKVQRGIGLGIRGDSKAHVFLSQKLIVCFVPVILH